MNPNTVFSKKGEQAAREWLETKGWKCYDVSNIDTTWKHDIDIIAVKNEEARIIEIKYDSRIHYTGNMFIELITDKENNKPGWIETTASNYIMYGDSDNNVFYCMRTTDLRNYLKLYRNEYEIVEAHERNKVSIGALVSVDEYQGRYWMEIARPAYDF